MKTLFNQILKLNKNNKIMKAKPQPRKSADLKEKKEIFAVSCKVGDIYYAQWGYECTKIDFYQVVGRPTKYKVVLRLLQRNIGNQICHSSYYVSPQKNEFVENKNEFYKIITGSYLTDKTGELLHNWRGGELIESTY